MSDAAAFGVAALGALGLAAGVFLWWRARSAHMSLERKCAEQAEELRALRESVLEEGAGAAGQSGTDAEFGVQEEDERDRLFNLSTDMLAIGDFDQYLHQVNPAWVRILGWSRDELMSEPVRYYVHDEDQARTAETWEQLRQGIAVEGFEARFRCRDGTYRWLSWDSFPYSDRRLVFSVIRDLTAQKNAEQKVLEYQERLRSLSNQLAQVEERQRQDLALAIHDGLAQELFGIRAQMVLLKYPDKVKDLGAVVAGIIDILDATMEDARRLSFELFPPVLHEVGLAAAVSWLAHSFSERTGISCDVVVPGDEPVLTSDKRSMAYQCVRELLANVNRHAQARSVAIELWQTGFQLEIRVRDDGIGFAAESLEVVHDVRNTTSGFGLFSIRERLRSSGGHLQIESQRGGGASVTLTLPVSGTESRPSPLEGTGSD